MSNDKPNIPNIRLVPSVIGGPSEAEDSIPVLGDSAPAPEAGAPSLDSYVEAPLHDKTLPSPDASHALQSASGVFTPKATFDLRSIEETAEASMALGKALRPELVRQHVLIPSVKRELDYGTLLRLVMSQRDLSIPGTVRYQDIEPRYEKTPEDPYARPVLKDTGITNWTDLLLFLEAVLDGEEVDHRTIIDVTLRQWQIFSSYYPPPKFLRRATELVLLNPGKEISLTIKGDPMDPPLVYHFTKNGLTLSSQTPNEQATRYWQAENPVHSKMEAKLAENPKAALLFKALQKAHTENPNSSLEDFFQHGVVLANIPDHQRTLICGEIENLRSLFHGAFKEAISSLLEPPPAGVMDWNPLDTLLRLHPPRNDPANTVVSIGAGQMLGTWQIVRRIMDRGYLPLTLRMVAFATDPALVYEINEWGTNTGVFQDTPINPKTGKKIYILPGPKDGEPSESIFRDEFLLTYTPEYIALNLKAGALSSAINPHFVKIIDVFKPAMSTPVKGFDAEGRIPYLVVHALLKKRSRALANRLDVLAGFFEAKRNLKDELGSFAIAGPEETDLEPRQQKAVDVIRRYLTPQPLNEKNRADWEAAEVEIIEDFLMAAFLQASGGHKNWLIYRTVRKYADRIFHESLEDIEAQLKAWEEELDEDRKHNITISEDNAARIMRAYGLSTDHLRSPDALQKDFRKCLPPNLLGLVEIRKKLDALPGSATPIDDLKRLLNDIIDHGLGGGTRNARDASLDSALKATYDDSALSKGYETYKQFYDAHYPKKWTRTDAQEGRTGNATQVARAFSEKTTLRPEAYEAFNLYKEPNGISMRTPSESKIIPTQRRTDPDLTWGLENGTLDELFPALSHLREQLTLVNRGVGDEQQIGKALVTIHKILGSKDVQKAEFSEVSQRILASRMRVASIRKLLIEEALDPELKKRALEKFERRMDYVFAIFKKPPKNTTQLTEHLIEFTKLLYDVEVELDQELKKKRGLFRDRTGRTWVPLPRYSSSPGFASDPTTGDLPPPPQETGGPPSNNPLPKQSDGSGSEALGNLTLTGSALEYVGVEILYPTQGSEALVPEVKPKPNLRLVETKDGTNDTIYDTSSLNPDLGSLETSTLSPCLVLINPFTNNLVTSALKVF